MFLERKSQTRADAEAEKCDLLFAARFLLGASAGLSSLGTWERTPMDTVNEANLQICTNNIEDFARKRSK